MAQSPLDDATRPVDIKEEGRSSTADKQWQKKIHEISLESRKSCKKCEKYGMVICTHLGLICMESDGFH